MVWVVTCPFGLMLIGTGVFMFCIWPVMERKKERDEVETVETKAQLQHVVAAVADYGQEEVKLGPLPADARPLPATVTAVVVDTGDGCFELTVNLFAEHTEDTRYCVDPSGSLALDGHTKHQRIGALSPVATMSCDPGTLIEEGSDTLPLSCDLSLDGGPASIKATLAGTATHGATERLTIAHQSVPPTPPPP